MPGGTSIHGGFAGGEQSGKKLIGVQIDPSSAHFPSEYRYAVLGAEIEIDFVSYILVAAYAEIWSGRRADANGFPAKMSQGVVEKLGLLPRNYTQIIELHSNTGGRIANPREQPSHHMLSFMARAR